MLFFDIHPDYKYWSLELPDHFQGARCIDVHVEGSITGPGPTIAETRWAGSKTTPFQKHLKHAHLQPNKSLSTRLQANCT